MKATNTITLLLGVGKVIKGRLQKELPLSYVQCETLRLLDQEKNMTMRAIALHFGITPPSATAIINGLVDARLVARTGNSKDRREVLLHLSAHGKKTLSSIENSRKKIVARVLSVLKDSDRKQLDVILEKIIVGAESY